jgi:hypothetical protein
MNPRWKKKGKMKKCNYPLKNSCIFATIATVRSLYLPQHAAWTGIHNCGALQLIMPARAFMDMTADAQPGLFGQNRLPDCPASEMLTRRRDIQHAVRR